jgi:rubrerythrin
VTGHSYREDVSEPLAIVETAADEADRERFAPLDGRLPSRSCAACGYGIAVDLAPDRCPMCGGADWVSPSAC